MSDFTKAEYTVFVQVASEQVTNGGYLVMPFDTCIPKSVLAIELARFFRENAGCRTMLIFKFVYKNTVDPVEQLLKLAKRKIVMFWELAYILDSNLLPDLRVLSLAFPEKRPSRVRRDNEIKNLKEENTKLSALNKALSDEIKYYPEGKFICETIKTRFSEGDYSDVIKVLSD